MGVLENINIHDGSGNTLTSTSSALDVNLKTSAATVTVAQPTGSDLHTVVDSGTLTSITDPVTVAQPTATELNATVRNQDGAGNPLTSTGSALDSNLKTIGGTAIQTGTGGSGAGIPRVTVADDSKVQPWDGTNSAKFDSTGEQTIDITRFGGATVQLGQSNMAHSIPVAFASDQQLAVSGVYNNQTGTVTSGTVPTTQDGTLTLVNDVFTWSTLVLNFVAPAPNSSPALSLGGTFQVEGSVDGNTWNALTGTLLSDTPEQVTEYTTTGFVTCSARYNLAGFPWIRLRTTQPFTGTINVQQCLTTAQGDEVGFTTARIVDDSGNSVDLTPAAQYTEGQSPQAIYFQGGQTNLAAFPESQVAIPADAVYALPKRSQIGNTLVIAVVIEGTNLTAANLAPMWLGDTAGSIYTLAQMYDSTVTSAGQAIALYVRTITAVDNEGQIGLMLGFNGTIGAGQPITSITGINILVHEYSGVVVPGDSFAHVMTPANTSGQVSAPIAPYVGYLVYSLVSSQTAQELSMNRLSTGPYTGAAPYPVESCTGDNVASFTLSTAWDWVCVKLPIATTGQVMMGRLIGGDGDGPIQAIKIDPASGGVLAAVTNDPLSPLNVSVIGGVEIASATTFPVQLQDGSAEPISSTSGSLNVNVTNAVPVTPSGTWSITATNGSVGTPGQVPPAQTTVVGAVNNGTVEALQLDANNNLKVSGTVEVSNLPATQPVSGTVSIGNLPATQPVSGTVNAEVTGGNLNVVNTVAVVLKDGSGESITSTGGSLNVNITGGTTGGGGGDTQYTSGQLSGVNTTGTVAMGGYGSGAQTVAVPLSVSSTGVLKVDGSAVTQPVSGTVSTNLASNGTPITNTGGAIDVNVKSGVTNTQYASGTAIATPSGTVTLGTDGTNVRALTTTAAGLLKVDVAQADVPLTVAQSVAANLKATVQTQDGSGNALTSTSGALDVNIKSSGVTVPVSISGTPTVTSKVQDGSGNALTSTSGALDVNIKSGAASGTQYAAGTAVATPTGTVALGTDGSDVRALKTDATGRLNVIIAGSSGPSLPVQMQAGSTPISADANGVLNVNVTGGSVPNSAFINGDGSANPLYPLACTLYGFSLTNLTSAPVYIEFFDTQSISLGTSTVVFCVVIPANGNVTIPPTVTGLKSFYSGLGFAATTAGNGTTTAAVTGMIFYK